MYLIGRMKYFNINSWYRISKTVSLSPLSVVWQVRFTIPIVLYMITGYNHAAATYSDIFLLLNWKFIFYGHHPLIPICPVTIKTFLIFNLTYCFLSVTFSHLPVVVCIFFWQILFALFLIQSSYTDVDNTFWLLWIMI